MPGPVTDLIAEPAQQLISVERSSALSCFHSLLMLVHVDKYSGLGEWVYETEAALTDEERERHTLVMIGLHYAARPQEAWSSFPAFIDHLEALPAPEVRDRILRKYHSLPLREGGETEAPFDPEAILRSEEGYMAYLAQRFPEKVVQNAIERLAYRYLIDPPALQALVTSHLKSMWDRFLAKEWEENATVENASVEAFRKVDFTSMSKQDALAFFSGQPADLDHWTCMLRNAERLVFVPSIHIGPYLGYLEMKSTLYIFFGARSPQGFLNADYHLSHAELLVRLRALADDNRLRILKMLAHTKELKSQDIIERLDLSQSAASRHLQQLGATGFLTERRCEGAKCYQFNPSRMEDTLEALRSYLLKGPGEQA
ncbi:MAG: winged helix-turn-helix transcriptional regulator [Anaerolineales bacterium]|nr:winged helix-turn-helix transcriptional regulator [Anaerolineales bacterium]